MPNYKHLIAYLGQKRRQDLGSGNLSDWAKDPYDLNSSAWDKNGSEHIETDSFVELKMNTIHVNIHQIGRFDVFPEMKDQLEFYYNSKLDCMVFAWKDRLKVTQQQIDEILEKLSRIIPKYKNRTSSSMKAIEFLDMSDEL